MLEDASLERLDTAGRARLAVLSPYLPLRTAIEDFWLRPEHRRTASWLEHADINDVMLATSLAPDGFLALASPAPLARRRSVSASPSSAGA